MTFVFPNPGALSKSSRRCLYPSFWLLKTFRVFHLLLKTLLVRLSGLNLCLLCFFTVSFVLQILFGSPLCLGAGLGAGDRHRAPPRPGHIHQRHAIHYSVCWCPGAMEGAKSWLRAAAQRGAWRTCCKKQGLGQASQRRCHLKTGLQVRKQAEHLGGGEGEPRCGRGVWLTHHCALVGFPTLCSPSARS